MACAAERAAVEALLRRRDLAPRVRERAEMVKASLLGQDAGWIAAWPDRSEQTVRLWLDRYARGGLGALADAPRCAGGRQRRTRPTWRRGSGRRARRRGRWGWASTS